MSNIRDATCSAAGVVTADGVPVDGVTLFGAGKAASSGILVMQEGQLYYIPISFSDLKTTLEKLSAAVGQIASTLTSIGAGMTGPTTAPPPTLVADVATLNSIKAEVDLLKEALK